MMKQIKNEIDRELSAFTFDRIDRERYGGLPAKRKEKSMKLHKKPLIAGVAAALAAVFTVSVGAANEWNYAKLLRGFFPSSTEESAEKLGGYMQEVTAAENTFTEVEASFDGAIYDGNFLMVSATFRKKDGTPFEDANYDMNFDCSWYGAGVIERTLRKDGSISVFMLIDDTSDFRNGESVSVKFSHLTRYSGDGEEKELIDDGEISTEFIPEWCSDSRKLSLSDGKGGVVTADVTPISIRIRYPQNPTAEEERYKIVRPVISGAGGVLIGKEDYHTITGGQLWKSNEDYQLFSFVKPIDFNEITHIDCGDYSTPSRSDAVNGDLQRYFQTIPAENTKNTFEKYNVSFDGILCDGYSLLVSLTVENPSEPFDESARYYSMRYGDFEGLVGRISASSDRFDPNEDGTLTVRRRYELTDPLKAGETIHLSFDGLYTDDGEALDDGEISAEFPIEIYESPRSFTLKNAEGETITADLTPLSVVFHAEIDDPPFTAPIGYDAEGECLFDANEASKASGRVSILRFDFSRPIDADLVERIEWNGYRSE